MAEITLDDIIKAPTDDSQLMQHLLSNGYVQPPPAPAAPTPLVPPASAEEIKPMSPVTPKSDVAEMKPPTLEKDVTINGVTHKAGTPDWTALSVAQLHPNAVKPMTPVTGTAPEFPMTGTGGPLPGTSEARPSILPPIAGPTRPTDKQSIEAGMAQHGTTAKEEGKRQYEELRPQVTAAPGTREYDEQKLAQNAFDAKHGWGADISTHPGKLGKLGHVLGEIGQIGAMAVMPGVVANIPGNMFSRELENSRLGEDLFKQREQEVAEKSEATREKQAENTADLNQQKLENAETKLDQEWSKIQNVRERDLRRQGLMPNPLDPQGQPVAIPYDAMSPTEQGVYDLKQAQAQAAGAKAALDQIKADPNSPQSQAMLQRVRIMAQNAATAAGKLGLDQKKFVADYFGLDENGNPIPGVQTTPEGKPVGPKVAGTTQKALSEFNTHYEKPASDVEQGYQKFMAAYEDYKHGSPTGAPSMVALSQHLATTFGTVKGSRITKDMIHEHKDAIGWFDKMQRYGQQIASGQQLSADQWADFGRLIANTREIAWQTAVKEAKRANLPIDFLPADLKGLGAQGKGGAAAAPAPPAGKVTVIDPQGNAHFVNEKSVDDFLNDPKYKGWKRGR